MNGQNLEIYGLCRHATFLLIDCAAFTPWEGLRRGDTIATLVLRYKPYSGSPGSKW